MTASITVYFCHSHLFQHLNQQQLDYDYVLGSHVTQLYNMYVLRQATTRHLILFFRKGDYS
jgi:hypothetical protein